MPESEAPTQGIEKLLLGDFTRTSNTMAGVLQTVMEHLVPRGEARSLRRWPGRLTLGKRDAFVGNGALKTFALLSILVNSQQFSAPARAFKGATAGGVAAATELVYTSAAAPAAGQFTIDATNNIVLAAADAAPSAAETVWVYYAFSDGRYTVEVFAANEKRHDSVANGSILGLNVANQNDVNSVWAINANTPYLPQDTAIRVQVQVADADSLVNFDEQNVYTNIELPYTRIAQAAIKSPDAQLAGLGR